MQLRGGIWGRGRGRQRSVEGWGALPLLARAALVARTECQAVRLADGGAPHNGRREKEGIRHPAYERQLLPVLFPEIGSIGRDDLQELEDDGEHAVEMPGAMPSLHGCRQLGLGDTV